MPTPTLPHDVRQELLGDGLTLGRSGLELDGVDLGSLAARHGTPLYVYGRQTLSRRFDELEEAGRAIGRPFEIRYAMKSNRFGSVLDLVRQRGLKVDTCSPREVERALTHGFSPERLSLTAGMLSQRDLAQVARYGVKPNLDTFSVIRRWAETPGRGLDRIGLRINPEVSVGWGEEPKLAYGNSKFGFDQDKVLDAVAFARSHGLEVD
ncbi:MAG TPA: hypothetical protein PK095_16190, partial [Myxococcota bacterium]|nr:hypothetical protein [Myxococcota bacterium]